MPDYNPDKEGHRKKKFIVQKAFPNSFPFENGVSTSKGELQFDNQDRFSVKDEALAREIQQQYPKELAVTRVNNTPMIEQGHKYFFGMMPAMPWHKYDESGNRIDEDAREIDPAADLAAGNIAEAEASDEDSRQ